MHTHTHNNSPHRKEELLLEEKESANIELNLSLLKACRDERKLFCKVCVCVRVYVYVCVFVWSVIVCGRSENH